MNKDDNINLGVIFEAFKTRIGVTWLLVLLETIGLALIPLAMGISIDGLLSDNPSDLLWLGGLLVTLTIASVARRIYDTRIYGAIKVKLGTVLNAQQSALEISQKSARLDMGRELVDFLEEELPILISALVQITITLVVLAVYDFRLSIAAIVMTATILLIYSLFHKTLYHCNTGLNNRIEQQVSTISTGKPRQLLAHLLGLKKWEVRLSDREAILYGCVFLVVTIFIIYNLLISAMLDQSTAGRLFTILSYSWDYVEAVIALPATLMIFTRIKEITQRLAVKSTPFEVT